MNPEVKFQQADGDLPFPRGVEETGRKSLAVPSLASARTGHSGNLREEKLLALYSPGKLFSRKRQEKLHSSSVCRRESMHWGWERVSSLARVRTHMPAHSEERQHLGFFWCPSKLCLSPALPFTWGGVQWHQSSFSLFNHPKYRGDNTGGKQWEVETHIIFPFPVPLQLKVEPSSTTKSYMCRRHFSG